MRRLIVLAMAIIPMAGCRRAHDLMPLHEGAAWTYTVQPSLQTYVARMAVTRPVSIGGVEGFELAGDLGVNRLAWKEDQLVTDQAANCQFLPPLPILAPGIRGVNWSGWAMSMGRREPAKASVRSDDQRIAVLGRTVKATRSTVDLRTPGHRIQLTTWFEPGVGIVQQEQRTDGHLDTSIQFLSGG